LFGFSQTYHGTILRVIDGDTYVLQTNEGSLVIRLEGIDAPEKDQPYSKESAGFLENYLNRETTVIKTGIDVMVEHWGRRLLTA